MVFRRVHVGDYNQDITNHLVITYVVLGRVVLGSSCLCCTNALPHFCLLTEERPMAHGFNSERRAACIDENIDGNRLTLSESSNRLPVSVILKEYNCNKEWRVLERGDLRRSLSLQR